MGQKVLKSGNSLVVSIPAEFARIRSLKPGMSVTVRTDAIDGTLVYIFPKLAQLSLL